MSGSHRALSALAGGLCFALAATVAPASAHAAEPAASVEYRSAFEGYRAFDAQAVLVAWRQTNAAILTGRASAGRRAYADPEALRTFGTLTRAFRLVSLYLFATLRND